MNAPRIGSLCTGYGGLDEAVRQVFGGELAWVSDIDPGACQIITCRMPGVPNIGDLTTTQWADLEPVDIVCGGYPCQPFSVAGRRKGTADERHIWPHIAHAIRVLRPRVAVFENVAGHLRLGFDTVLADLARLGFDAEWCTVRASEVGAPHHRNRLFILAVAQDADGAARDQRRFAAPGQAESRGARADARRRGGTPAADASSKGLEGPRTRRATPERATAPADAQGVGRGEGRPEPARLERRPDAALSGTPDWGDYAPAIARWEAVTGRPAPWATDDRNRLNPAFVEWLMGLPAGWVTQVPGLSRNAQLKALGNGVVPQQAEAAIRMLADRAGIPTTQTTPAEAA